MLLGNGDGTFQSAVTYDSGGYEPYSFAIADVNGDGKPDLLVANSCGSIAGCVGDGAVAVLLGNGDGTSQPAVNYDTGAFSAEAVAVADLRGDGKLDLLVANRCGPGCPFGILPITGVVGILLGNGDGTFQPATTYPTSAALTDAVAVADLNGDGKLDIAVGNNCAITTPPECKGAEGEGVGRVDVFVGNGDGTFQNSTPYDTSAADTGSVAIADVNGDGIPDLEVAVVCAPFSATCSYASSAGVLLGSGDGTFQAAQYFGPIGNLEAQGAAGQAVADVDGDGKPDLVLINSCGSCEITSDRSVVGVMLNTSTFPNSASSTTSVTSSPNPSNVGQSVTFTVTVSASGSSNTPAGTVSLFDGSTSLGLFPVNSSGIATAAFTTLASGTNSMTATYHGDASLTPSTSLALSQVVLGQDFN